MTSESNNSSSKLPLSVAVLPVLGGVPGAGGPLHPQVMADVLAGRERYGAELLALGAAHAAPGADADPNQLAPEVDMTKVEERHLAVAYADVQEEDKEEVNLSGRELRLLLHLGAMSARLQRKFMPQLGDANTIRDVRKLLTVIKDIAVTADKSTMDALASLGVTVIDSVLRNEELTAIVEEYARMLQDAVAAGGPLPAELRKAPAKFGSSWKVRFHFRVLKQKWDFSFGEGSVQVDVHFELAHRVVNKPKTGDDGNANLDDQFSPLDKTFDAADCVQLPLGAAGDGQVAMLPPDAYAVLEDGTTVCNSSAVAGIPLVRRAKDSHFRAACASAAVVPVSQLHLDAPEQQEQQQVVQGREWETFLRGTKGKRGNDPGLFNYPYQTAVDHANQRVLVAEYSVGPRVRVLGMDGQHKEWLAVEGLDRAQGIALDPATGVIVVSSWGTHELIMLDGDGGVLYRIKHGDLKSPYQVTIAEVAGRKEVHVASWGVKSVVVFDMAGQHARTIKHGYRSYGVAVGPDGLVCSIEVFSQDGQHVRQFASGLTKPWGISFNSRGYMAVGSNTRPAGHVTVYAPDGSVFYTGRECASPDGVEWINDRQLLVSMYADHQVELLTVPGL